MSQPDLTASSSDPFAGGLAAYAKRLRSGEISILACVDYCLNRIDQYDEKLHAFQVVDADAARETAKALDNLLAKGTDLGPLMGVPIGVKDIMAANGFPTTNGSLYEAGIPGEQDGPIVATLRQSGCVILGKTKTVEYALGATGVNEARGTPWNPWDLEMHRIPGGSSSGSAVSVSAGFTGFALGTDTGGSVRIPACYNGLFGHKTTVGLWSTEGVFPLSPTLDSIGPICRSAADAALIHSVICATDAPRALPYQAHDLSGIKLGLPTDMFLDNLDDDVTRCFEACLEKLLSAGATIVDVELPEAHEKTTLFPNIVPPELLNSLTSEGFAIARDAMDTVTRERAEFGLSVSAIDYVAAQQRHAELIQIANSKMQGLDGWISPTCPFTPLSVPSLEDPFEHQRSGLSSKNTQPGNLMRLCACSMPIQQLGDTSCSGLPVGLQLMLPGGEDERLLSLAQTLQNVLGIGSLPTLS